MKQRFVVHIYIYVNWTVWNAVHEELNFRTTIPKSHTRINDKSWWKNPQTSIKLSQTSQGSSYKPPFIYVKLILEVLGYLDTTNMRKYEKSRTRTSPIGPIMELSAGRLQESGANMGPRVANKKANYIYIDICIYIDIWIKKTPQKCGNTSLVVIISFWSYRSKPFEVGAPRRRKWYNIHRRQHLLVWSNSQKNVSDAGNHHNNPHY